MPKYNTKFTLNLDDMELIETALRTATSLSDGQRVDARAAHDLLGRLHDQKVFYRPEDRTYISG